MLWNDLLQVQREEILAWRPLRILVCGSRGWTNVLAIQQRLAVLPGNTVVIYGGAIGADTLAANCARRFGLHVLPPFLPDWKKYGRRAGFERNKEMLDEEPDLVIAFWDGVSRGTKDTIDEAVKRRIAVEVVTMVESGVNVDVLV